MALSTVCQRCMWDAFHQLWNQCKIKTLSSFSGCYLFCRWASNKWLNMSGMNGFDGDHTSVVTASEVAWFWRINYGLSSLMQICYLCYDFYCQPLVLLVTFPVDKEEIMNVANLSFQPPWVSWRLSIGEVWWLQTQIRGWLVIQGA